MNSNYKALVEIMSNARVEAFLRRHLATYDSAVPLMLLMKVYIELDAYSPHECVEIIDAMLCSRTLRQQMHLLIKEWQRPLLDSKLCLGQGAVTE